MIERFIGFFKSIFAYFAGESSQKRTDKEAALAASNDIGQVIVNAQQKAAPVSGTTGADVADKLHRDGGL